MQPVYTHTRTHSDIYYFRCYGYVWLFWLRSSDSIVSRSLWTLGKCMSTRALSVFLFLRFFSLLFAFIVYPFVWFWYWTTDFNPKTERCCLCLCVYENIECCWCCCCCCSDGGGGVSEFGLKIYYLVFTMCLFLSGFRRHVCRLIMLLVLQVYLSFFFVCLSVCLLRSPAIGLWSPSFGWVLFCFVSFSLDHLVCTFGREIYLYIQQWNVLEQNNTVQNAKFRRRRRRYNQFVVINFPGFINAANAILLLRLPVECAHVFRISITIYLCTVFRSLFACEFRILFSVVAKYYTRILVKREFLFRLWFYSKIHPFLRSVDLWRFIYYPNQHKRQWRCENVLFKIEKFKTQSSISCVFLTSLVSNGDLSTHTELCPLCNYHVNWLWLPSQSLLLLLNIFSVFEFIKLML